jgi:PAS domain S-box-containing protein
MLSGGFISRIRARIGKLDKDILRELVLRFAEEREFFEVILNSMNEGVLVTDEQDRVQYANRTAARLLGRSIRGLRGNPVLEGIESIDFYNLVKRAFENNERVRNKEVSLYYPADRILNVNIFPLMSGTDVSGRVVIFMDITQEKEEEQRLRRAESMAALSSITAGIAHEIKNPLGALDIHLQLLEKVLDGDAPPDRERMHRYLEVVREEVGRLNGIVVDFLDAVRPLRSNPRKTVVGTLLEEVAAFWGPVLQGRGIHLDVVQEELPLEANVDPDLLRQAIANLVKNAGEAIAEDGLVKLSARREGEYLEIQVEDNGCGIEQERLGRIFEPYHTTKSAGTGLGLTIVYRIVKEHGGTIHVESAPGVGTRFAVRIPLWGKGRKLLQ